MEFGFFSTSFLLSPTPYALRNCNPKLNKGSVVSDSSRLTDYYPSAFTDFSGIPSGAPCVYKSGPAWSERRAPESQSFIRELRPVYGHPIAASWPDIGTDIYQLLDSRSVLWTSIDPVAFANAGEKKPFCPLLIWIGVKPNLLYGDAVAAANAIKGVLSQAGFPNIEVAFRESEVTRFVSGPKLLPLDPLDAIAKFRKAFTPTLGLSIAQLKTPDLEGTGALYFRLSKDDDRVVLLTAAHVARPPPVYPNTGMSHKHASQPREEVVALGNIGYQNAKDAMVATIESLTDDLPVWEDAITRLGEFVDGEDAAVTKRRQQYQHAIEEAMGTIESLNNLHDEVAKRRADLDQRTIGYVLHAEPIVVSDGPNKFTRDWAFIQIDKEKIDWNTFPGNKVYVGTFPILCRRFSLADYYIPAGGNLSSSQFGRLMFPQPEDRKGYMYPRDGLLQAYGVVKDDEIRQPQHLDAHGEKALLVVKNGLTTGTTIGRANGLDSFTRFYTDHDIKNTSIETAILPYDKRHCPFSAKGDSGAIILDRAGRIVALLTGGSGKTDETDVTYGTPYWWLETQIKKAFPDCFLYA